MVDEWEYLDELGFAESWAVAVRKWRKGEKVEIDLELEPLTRDDLGYEFQALRVAFKLQEQWEIAQH